MGGATRVGSSNGKLKAREIDTVVERDSLVDSERVSVN